MRKQKIDLKKNRIRTFFLTLEKKTKDSEELDDIQAKVEKEGMEYIQMRLPVEKITEEFENTLKKKIEQNIITAKIQEATIEHIPTICNLYNRAWLTTNTPFRAMDLESISNILKDPDTTFLIARVYGMDAGFVILDYEGENKEIGIIAGLGVLPRFHRRGLGTVLGMAAWDIFKKKGVMELRCEVYKDNSVSYSFIKWIGFEERGRKVYRKQDFLLED